MLLELTNVGAFRLPLSLERDKEKDREERETGGKEGWRRRRRKNKKRKREPYRSEGSDGDQNNGHVTRRDLGCEVKLIFFLIFN